MRYETKTLHLSIVIGIPIAVIILTGTLFYSSGEPTCVVAQPEGTSSHSIIMNTRGANTESNRGQLVFLMKPACKAQLFVNYGPVHPYQQMQLYSRVHDGKTGEPIPWWVFSAAAKPDTIQGNATITVTYTLTSHDKGVYWLDLGICNPVPIVVGIDRDNITRSDLQDVMSRWFCPFFDLQFQITNSSGLIQAYVEPRR